MERRRRPGEDEVAGLGVPDGLLSGVRLASGEVVARQAVVVAPGFTASADLLTGLGAKPVDQVVHGAVRGTHVPADPTGLTEVAGVAGVTGLADFANSDLTLALCAREVPCGAAGITRSRTPSKRTSAPGVGVRRAGGRPLR